MRQPTTMPDSDWWKQQGKPRPARQPVRGEPLFEFRVGNASWRSSLGDRS
jgi:hypothetical protein